ncbi:MAG: hypothetical protein A2Y58_04190 [Chloroflexi bacterium RBG_13_51_52]|nr:MAG: hypothetical protein A2Y58_04190 [Chloroflexi bacterium RBG_13_51_52]
MKKPVLISLATLMAVIGLVSAIAAVFLSNPYYSLPAIPIAILAVAAAAYLYFFILGPRKNHVWLNIFVCVVIIFTCSSFAVITQDFVISRNYEPKGIYVDKYKSGINIIKLDQDIAEFEIVLSFFNRSNSNITINKIDLNICPWEHKNYLTTYNNWVPTEILGARQTTPCKTTISITNKNIVSYISNGTEVNYGVSLKIEGLIQYKTDEGIAETSCNMTLWQKWQP